MSYIAFAWITTFLYAASGLLGKISSKHQISNPWLFNFVWSFIILLIALISALVAGVGLPQDWYSMFLVSFVGAIAGTLWVLALFRLDVSILSPLYSFRTPISVLLGVFLFREALTQYQLALIGVITAAGFFVSMDEQFSMKSFLKKSIALGLCAVTVSALYSASIKNAIFHNGYWEVILWSNILTQIFLLATVPLFWKDIRHFQSKKYVGVLGSAVAAGIGGLAAIKAFGANVSISTAIVSIPISMILVVPLSYIAPKLLEKHSLKVYAVRFIAAGIMFAAALGLSR